MGFTLDTSGFDRATKAIQDGVRRNTQTYGRVLAQTFETEAKSGAPWVDRRGNARTHLYGTTTTSGNRVRVEMGGSAPNYKRGPKTVPDYLEILEFDFKKKYAIVEPTAEAIFDEALQNFGEAALNGHTSPRISIKRDKAAARERARRRRLGLERDRHDLRGRNGRFMKNATIG